MVLLVPPQVVGLDTQQHIHIGQALGAVVPGLLPGPQLGAEIAVKADGKALLPGLDQAVQDKPGTAGGQGRGDSAEMQPVEALQQGIQVHPGKIVLGDGAVPAVVGHLAGADAVAGLQIIGAQPVGGGFLGGGQDNGSTVDVVGPEHPHRTFSQGIVGDDGEKGAVHPQIGQRKGDIGLAAAVAGLKAVCHPDFTVVGRGETEHDLPEGNKFLSALPLEQRVGMYHAPIPPYMLRAVSVEASVYCPGETPSPEAGTAMGMSFTALPSRAASTISRDFLHSLVISSHR